MQSILKTLAATAFSLLACVACGVPEDGSSEGDPRVDAIAALSGDTVNGETLYTNNCAVCHGADAKSGIAGEDITGGGEDAEYSSVILDGKNGGEMPGFSEDLSDQEIADILAYLASL